MKNDFVSIDDLFEKWRSAHKSEKNTDYLDASIPKKTFLPDGIIDESKFYTTKPRILFIADESNLGKRSAQLSIQKPPESVFWLKEVAFGKTAAATLSRRLSAMANAYFSDNYTDVNTDRSILQSIAFINLNKRGGYRPLDENALRIYVSEYHDYIRAQIEFIKPELVICCGDIVKELVNEHKLVNNIKMIKVYHPSFIGMSDPYFNYIQQLKCELNGEEWQRPRKK